MPYLKQNIKVLDPEIKKQLAERSRLEIQQAIIDFGKDLCDDLINKFRLTDLYKKEYEDTNFIYKVKAHYQENHITNDLSLHYIRRVKKLIPGYENLWKAISFKKNKSP